MRRVNQFLVALILVAALNSNMSEWEIIFKGEAQDINFKILMRFKNTLWYYTPKRLISYLLSNYFLLISYKAAKTKRIEKRSA